jgi:hypothetical protein
VQPHVVGTGIDKCSIGLVYSNALQGDALPWEDLGALLSWVHSVKCGEFAEISGGQKGTYKRHKSPATYTRANQPLASGNSVRCLYGCHRGMYRAWVGLNPTLSHLGEINFHLQQMFALGFETLRRHGAISECEFFVDINDAEFNDYLYIDTALRIANPEFMPQGTMYLGSRNGKRRLTIYDKAKHLRDMKAILLPTARLRVEGKVTGSIYRLKDLALVRNPFATLHVLDKVTFDKLTTPAAATLQKHLHWGMSAQVAYQCLSKANKAELAEVLEESRPSWWQPVEVWERVLANLGWMDVLGQAGLTGEYLPLGEAAYQQSPIISA